MPDTRDRVLLTRPEAGAAATAARVAARGFVPVIAPLARIERLAAKLPNPAGLQALIVTSSNALAAIPSEWRTLPLFAVGDATAVRARADGFRSVASASGDAGDLACLIARSAAPNAGPLLLASGAGQGTGLAERLERAGFSVIRREVYATRMAAELPDPARVALDSGRLRSALFFSAETARTFVALVIAEERDDQMRTIDALAIGRPAGVALEQLPWQAVHVAARPTQDDLLALLR